ncbi:MAG: class I SAM-dependent methyltransferase [Dehalococcoidia bacterium]
MATTPVYEDIGKDYNANRRADPRVVHQLIDLLALPPYALVADVGAGTGNYSSALVEAGYRVVAMDPSLRMLQQASPDLRRLASGAQAVPLRDASVDGLVSTMTLQHLRPLIGEAAREMRRVLRDGPAVLLVVDPREAQPFWFADYFPAIRARMFDSYAPLSEIEAHFRAAGFTRFEVTPFPLPADFSDMNMHSGWNRPEIYLDAHFRQNMSPFALASEDEIRSGVEKLQRDLDSGAWDAAHGGLRQQASFDLGFRFLRASF